jgi:hypothetical protein
MRCFYSPESKTDPIVQMSVDLPGGLSLQLEQTGTIISPKSSRSDYANGSSAEFQNLRD